MRIVELMRIIEKKVYTIDELKEVNKEAYEKAINNVHDRMTSEFMAFEEAEDTLMSTQHAHEYANHNGLEFFEDGEIF